MEIPYFIKRRILIKELRKIENYDDPEFGKNFVKNFISSPDNQEKYFEQIDSYKNKLDILNSDLHLCLSIPYENKSISENQYINDIRYCINSFQQSLLQENEKFNKQFQ